MSKSDDIAAAELASIVGGHLNTINGSMVARSSTSDNNIIHPSQFLTNVVNSQSRQTTNNAGIPSQMIIDPPKSRSIGSEIAGVEAVDVKSLLIPIEGADNRMREAIRQYSNESATVPPKLQATPTNQPVKQELILGHATPANSHNVIPDYMMSILEEINGKLDILLKRAKITSRYKKVKHEKNR